MSESEAKNRMPEINEATLLRYLDGEASAAEVKTIKASEDLSRRANQLAEEQIHWGSQLARAECPDTMTLGEYHLRLLPRREHTVIELHVKECPLCTKELAEMSAFVGKPPKARLKEILETGREIVAELVEKAPGEPVMQERGFGMGTRLYMAEDLQLSLSVQPDKQDIRLHSITGLALGRETQGMVAHLVKEGESVQMTHVDDLGNFHFTGVNEGLFDVLLSGENVVVRIGFIQI